jgi:hypothetical protein
VPDSPAPEDYLDDSNIYEDTPMDEVDENEDPGEIIPTSPLPEQNTKSVINNENLQSKNFKDTQRSINLNRNKNVSQRKKSNKTL